MNFSNHNKPVLCTEHLANFVDSGGSVRDSKGRLVSYSDWEKIPKILNGTWPKKHPYPYINAGSIIPNLLSVDYVVIDNEWNDEGIFQTGLYHPNFAPYIFDFDMGVNQNLVAQAIKKIISKVPVVFQNAVADIPRMEETYGINFTDYCRVDDTLLLHSCVWSELPHNLAFMGSVYSDYNKLKHLGPGSYEYLVGDLVDTDCVWRELNKEIDDASMVIYKDYMLPLIPIIIDAERRGIRVHQRMVIEKGNTLLQNIRFSQALAEVYTCYPINLDSGKQLAYWLTEVENVFGTTKKRRSKKGNLTLNLDVINELRYKYLPKEDGIEETPAYVMDRINRGGHPLLEARALYAESRKLYSSYIKPLLEDDNE